MRTQFTYTCEKCGQPFTTIKRSQRSCSLACRRTRTVTDPEIRFWAKVNRHGPEVWEGHGPCWVWTKSLHPDGYGEFESIPGASRLAHVYSYVLHYGAITEGLEPDHLCRNRSCVRPDHLEAVTHQVNVLRGVGMGARNAKKTHCPKGHPYDDENTYVYPSGGRGCRACARMRTTRRPAARSKGAD